MSSYGRWQWWEWSCFLIVLTMCVATIMGVSNAIFDDKPKPPVQPYDLTPEQQCVHLGGVPHMDGYQVKDCQFKPEPAK